MESILQCCAGLDIHKDTVEAHVRRLEADGTLWQQTRPWGTMSDQLRGLRDWLASLGVTHVAMESTGVYWKPIYNILEERFTLLLANARHIQQVPGRKTDVRDCQWIAQLLQHGLLRGSFVPPRPQRELRDLTRHRMQVVGEKARVANRIQKVLEDANIKLSSVASDVLGVSGRAMLQALIAGVGDAQQLAELAQRKLRGKIPQLQRALEGHVNEHHRFLLRLLWEELQQHEARLEELDQRIAECTRPFALQREHLTSVPGIQNRVAEVLLAEVGAHVQSFPSAGHLASWAGMCPGNDQSAGKRRSGRTPPGNRWLKATLVQAAWAASRSRNTYLAAQYRRLARHRGKKRALLAVAHSLLVIVYHLLHRNTAYQELGANFFEQRDPQRLLRYHLKRLESLGYSVSLQPRAA